MEKLKIIFYFKVKNTYFSNKFSNAINSKGNDEF